MPKQVTLNGFVISSSSMPGSPTPTQIQKQKKSEEPKLTAIIMKLEQPEYGRCCLCKRKTLLPFCLEYLNGEGNIVLWGDVCQKCVDESTAERREVE